jgi:phage gp46-like protein
MATSTSRADFISLVAEEIVSGIDHAVGYWTDRLEQELTGSGLTTAERLRAVERLLREYKTGKRQLYSASA